MRPTFINVGERTNVTGSAKFRKLVVDGDYADVQQLRRFRRDAICRRVGAVRGRVHRQGYEQVSLVVVIPL